MRWFYHDGQQQVGPVDEAVLRSMAYDGRLQPGTPVWKEGTPSWTTAQQTELGSLFIPRPASPARPAASTPVKAKSNTGLVVALVVVSAVAAVSLLAVLGLSAGTQIGPTADSSEQLVSQVTIPEEYQEGDLRLAPPATLALVGQCFQTFVESESTPGHPPPADTFSYFGNAIAPALMELGWFNFEALSTQLVYSVLNTLNERYRVSHDDGRLFGIYAQAIVLGYLRAMTAASNGAVSTYAQPGAMPPDIRLDSDLRTRFMEILINQPKGMLGESREDLEDLSDTDFRVLVAQHAAWFGQEAGKVRPDPEASILLHAYGFYVAVQWMNMPAPWLDTDPYYIEAFARSFAASQLSAFGVTVRLPETLPPWKGRPN